MVSSHSAHEGGELKRSGRENERRGRRTGRGEGETSKDGT